MWRGFLRFRQASDGACPNTVSSHLAPLFSFHALLCISPFSLPFLFLTLEISSLVPFFVVCLLDAISLRNSWEWDGKHLTLAKMNAPLDIHLHRDLPKDAKPSSVTISKDCANRYFVSMMVEDTIETLPVVNKPVGLDLGLKSMVILSTGEAADNPKFYAKDETRLAKAQRRHAKKKKGSKNRNKARLKVAKIHARINDCRRDYQHKLSTRIVHENQVMYVKSLAVKNMVKNHKLAKAVSDVGWGEFIRQLDYKSTWDGRTLVKIDRWYPSSKTCHTYKHV